MRHTTVAIRCDFCGYGGAYSMPQDFTRAGAPGEEVDLCRWCSTPAYSLGSRGMCSGHEVTVGEKSWECSCGETFCDTGDVAVSGWPFFVPSRIRRAVPDLTTATAVHHLNNGWRTPGGANA